MPPPGRRKLAGSDDRLTDEERQAWQRMGRRHHYRNGSTLMREGEPARHVLLVEQGLTKITSTADDGGTVVLAIRGPGEILGDIAALDGGRHSASVFALGKMSAHRISREVFLDFLERYPRVSVVLLLRMSRRLREADGQRLEYGTRTVVQRLASRLLALAEDYGEPFGGSETRITVRLTQNELAASIAASREAVVKALRQLKNMNAATTDSHNYMICRDLSLLRGIASGAAPPEHHQQGEVGHMPPE